MSSQDQHQMKVKFIVTKYVETDEAQFKSVVQSLTGKDAVAGEGDGGGGSAGEGRSNTEVSGRVTEDRRRKAREEKAAALVTDCAPTMDELFDLLGD
ncbi:hypothetical protein KFK09_026276 [Dendrobium nobile]|uniref:VQ domain-containing protein n=1 Tax=Dendrobium nobile TaxID=94219 RepID=A0A8T3A7V6_DENNO|nr:hypothetical protein KFK09_026276 [Dendrobium nobile]